MKSSALLQSIAAISIVAAASAVSGQTAIQLFSPADIRPSTSGTGHGTSENVFNSKILNLSCPASGIVATLSSTTDGTGYVLVDNFISLAVTAGGQTTGPADVCLNGTVENGNQQNCFVEAYATPARTGSLNGTDPDTLLPAGGVAPIDVSGSFEPGALQAQFGLVDTGGYLAGSTLYLYTNCTAGGVTGPAQVTGNPISSSNPTPQQLTQNFSFNSSNNQVVQFTYDLSQSQNNGNLSITDGTAPTTGDSPIDPNSFPNYVQGTSFATANCLLHNGELLNNSPACKLYTLTCQVGTNPAQSGALCPESTNKDELFQEIFDGPSFTLPDIAGTGGQTFHQGIGFLEASEGWTGGSCVFDPNSNISNELCPQNILTSFSGPGAYKSGGNGQSPNSTFITVAPVPEDLTTVSVVGQHPGGWINSPNATVNFVSTPPSLGGQNGFVASPIQSLTYGISSASNVPQPPPPVPGDTVLPDTACPAPKNGNPPPATPFTPAAQAINNLSDGYHLIHYFAQDCAGTEELQFTLNGGSWATSFYTYPLNVDTVSPVISSPPTLSPAPSTNGGVANSYMQGQKVTASYSCSDALSGIVSCGSSTFPPGTASSGTITSPVDTSKPGSQTFTVNAVDAAGNPTSASVNYLVVAPSVNLYLLKLAAPQVKQNGTLTYLIAATLFGKQTTTGVTITDPLPAGVTFLSAKIDQLCGNGQCSNTASCSFANNTVSCSTASLSLRTPMLVEIKVSVQASKGTVISNTATLSATNPAVSPNHTTSTANTTVR